MKLWKKIMLGTSDAWSMSRLSHRPNEPEYYIEDCWISDIDTSQSNLIYNCVHSSWSRGMNIYWQRCAWECSPNCPHKSFRNFWLANRKFLFISFYKNEFCQKKPCLLGCWISQEPIFVYIRLFPLLTIFIRKSTLNSNFYFSCHYILYLS